MPNLILARLAGSEICVLSHLIVTPTEVLWRSQLSSLLPCSTHEVLPMQSMLSMQAIKLLQQNRHMLFTF